MTLLLVHATMLHIMLMSPPVPPLLLLLLPLPRMTLSALTSTQPPAARPCSCLR
jgi:hypothetical protein